MKQYRLKIIAVCMVVLLVLTGCGNQTVDTREKFVVGMECNYAPYNWTQATASDTSIAIDGGQYCDGFDVVMAQKVADGLNRELVIQKTSWDGLIPSLQSHQIDAIIAGMSPTDERRQEVNFSDIYYRGKFGVVVQKDGDLANGQSVNDFANARVTAQLGTHHVELMKQLVGIKELEPMKDFSTMTVSLRAGEIDAFIADDTTGKAITNVNKDLIYITLDGEQGLQIDEEKAGVAIGLRKEDTELTEQINQILSDIPAADVQAVMDQAIQADSPQEEGFMRQVVGLWGRNKSAFINGTIVTLIISITATLLGFLLGLLMAIIRENKIGKVFVTLYVTIIRGTPMMVQAMVIFYGVAFAINGFKWADIPFGNVMAGILIVTINTGAYMAETIRSGIQALDEGQFEAAKSLGFTKWQTMTKIILPQAIRNILPALGNEFIVNIKDTSVLNVISVVELYFISSSVAGSTYQYFQTFAITAMIYLLLTTIASILLRWLEQRLAKVETHELTSYPASQTDMKQMIDVKK